MKGARTGGRILCDSVIRTVQKQISGGRGVPGEEGEIAAEDTRYLGAHKLVIKIDAADGYTTPWLE